MGYTEFKDKIEKILEPLAFDISPNIITLVSILVMLGAAYCVLEGDLLSAGILVFLSGFLDVYDGTVAKKYRKATAFGALFDRTADRINDSIIIAAIVIAGYVELWIGIIALVTVVLASYISACLEAMTKTKIGEAISMRPVRTAIIIIVLLSGNPEFIRWSIILLAIIGAYSSLYRMLKS